LTLGELFNNLPSFSGFLKKAGTAPKKSACKKLYSQLFNFSGFPEPFLKEDKNFYSLWFSERKKLLIREDIRDASNIREISLLEMLSHLIPEKVGSPLSLNSLREVLGVAFETVREWVKLLGQFYYLFQVYPFAGSMARALKKESKVYLFDWAEVVDPALRFENMVALHLFKAISIWQAMGEGEIKLHYIRDKEKREVDFVLVDSKKPLCLIECKYNDPSPSANLLYFQEKLKVPLNIQLVHKSGISRKIKLKTGELYIISADQWLALLP
jgi:predicted AAA+ superfamily ATPase